MLLLFGIHTILILKLLIGKSAILFFKYSKSTLFYRRTEIIRWKSLIDIYYQNIQKEIEDMKNEKKQTEQTLEYLNLNFTVTNHCLSIRDERGGADLCHDIAHIELKNVHLYKIMNFIMVLLNNNKFV